jgi:Uma2 family endonuclease
MSPSLNHSYLCRKIILAVEQTGQWEAWPELALAIESGLIPDIAIYPPGVLAPNFFEDQTLCAVLPKVVIEVVSPSQPIHSLMLKAGKFIKAGIPAVWIVEPYGPVIYVSTPAGRKVQLAGVVESVGVRVDFAGIFGQGA